MTRTVSADSPATDRFHQDDLGPDCDCPIHRDRERPPVTVPLGSAFADHVTVEPIPQHVAGDIYAAHHSYMPDVPTVNLAHHGLLFQDQLVGAITYRFPLIRALEYDGREYAGDEIVEAARICLGVRMPNLASAALAASQERFVRDHARRRGVALLLTFVRADYDGAMIRALRDKGWERAGKTTPSQAGNRPEKAIRERAKWRFLCPVDDSIGQQSGLSLWV
ncbi:hypothetical protein [Halostella litorea]|uniref:hypothetical protein n=1 Tax=Halostella litorea TaxID=2528831 RepID=UPI001092D00E|nr:hypothetical protein [Halostella litorea]